ncbi:hypothetical protein [Streptomyces bluensis]|uniref:hypothetical protein n=1 Tax=Streptomyces bluensis TaxID=33897 RepID=UPI0019BA980E|nr:hypothetical protein [Streptomyces bluensis]GGZ84539.1 hypothetical protein GCM10010344_59890 [Streptomyces bluensis]
MGALIGVAVAAVAFPLAVASAGTVGDAGRMVARVSGLTDDKTRTTDGGAREGERAQGDAGAQGDGRTYGDDARTGESHIGEARGEGVSALSRSALSLGFDLATVTRCGPDLSSPGGIKAQTCVLTRDEETWARTYYRNATGEELSSSLSLMAPDGRSVWMRCIVGAQDEPGVCETPRERTRGDLGAYTAVAEFAGSAGRGPLLLRSGSNSPQTTGG